MLVPAISKKDELIQKSYELYFTDDYFYYMGDPSCCPFNIPEEPERGLYQFASVDREGNLIGYIAYRLDFYVGAAFNFGMICFNKGNMEFARDLELTLNDIINNPVVHTMNWRMVVGNPVEHTYDRFCKKHGGTKHIFHDTTRDRLGNWHNEADYEIVFNRGNNK